MGAYTSDFNLTTPFKSSMLDRLAERFYRWIIKVRFRYTITINKQSVAEFDEIWRWCHDNFDRQDWVFTWDGDIHNMTFCFRKPKQLVYFALRWA